MLLTAGQVWAMQLYVITPSGQVTLEVEPSDSFENIKVKIEDKTGFDPTYQHLYYNHIECYNNQTLYEVGITSGGQTLTMTYDFIPARQADGSWKFTMPNVNKLMEVEYYNTYTLTLSHNAGHGTVELLRPGSSATVGNAENAFQYCYDCQRSPAYPTVANNGNNNLFGFTNPYVGLNGVGVTNDPSGPWKLEYVGKYSHSEYNFSVSSVRHTYGLNSDEDVPIFLLYQWSSATNQYEPVVYGVACAYSKLNNTHGDDHTLLFVGEGHWGCFLSNNQHSQNLNISFDEDLSSGLPDFVAAATPALPDGVVDNHDGTYSVIHGTEVIIEAIANTAEYYYFDNWTNENGNEYAAGVVTPSGDRPATSLLTFVVTGDTTVRGNFKIDTYTMRVKTNNTSMGHVGIGETVYTSEYKDTVMTYHQHIDVTAIPEPGYYFVNWTNENGVEVSTSITLNWMATADTILTANFAAYATLQVASNNTAWGTVGEPQVSAGNTDHVMTLYDESESTSNHMVPAYTCWFDASTKSQYVIPASKMADAKGGTISSIQYYTQDPVSWISGVVDVYLKEVTDPTLSSMEDKSSCTVVYHGQLTFENKGVTITFTNPYPYNGGNLLVGLENEAAGYNCGIQFLGEDAPGASMSGFGGNYQQQDFLPQCTFTYQPSGVKVNPNGGYYIIPGSDVTVTATPETGYFLENWTNENSSVMGTDEQITLTVTGDTTVQGNFALKTYTVIVGGTPDQEYGSAEITYCPYCQDGGYNEHTNKHTYTVNHGTTITITATPTTGHHFAAWEGDIDSDVSPIEIVGVDRDYTINAYFEVNTYPVAANSIGHGSVALSGVGLTTDGQHGKYGGTVTFTANPDAGYRFVSWNDNNTDNPRHITISGEVHLTATFERNQHTLTLSAVGSGTVEIQAISGNKTIIPSSSISVQECCSSYENEQCDSLFDGIISGNNKWCSVAEPKFVEFRTTNAVQVNGYTLYTANDNASNPGRNPMNWVLKANLDGSNNWTIIDAVTNDATMQDVNYTSFDFEMDVPGTYRYFRFEVSAVHSGSDMQLGELQLFYEGNTLPNGVIQGPTPDTYIVDHGTVMTVKAIPDAGYALLEWSDDHSTDDIRTITVTSDTNLVANFGYLTPGLTPFGELTIFGHSFVSTTGEIKRVPCITGTGEFTKVGSREPTTIDLSTITEALTAQSGDTLTGTLDVEHYPVKISIAKGATVLLDGVTINGTHSMDYLWAGITCKGDATIILKDGTTNEVTGFNNEYPGIYVPMGSTLTIKGGTDGTGKLIAGSNGFAAGIGAGLNHKSCGNIIIQGGTIEATGDLYASGIGGAYVSTCGDIEITGGNITAQGGVGAAGIGGGRGANCGAINISGGTIIATGGEDAAGIGGGGPIDNYTHCDSITITSTVTSVTATKGGDAPNSIGAGKDGTCGTVTIGNSTGAISASPYTYQP